ncbi:MAG: CCA tRNA nucleotidyltransferase [Parvularculaceae bacterium]|nr:CCA tRNA nucleotidyltransferase [Parvularculaceae bacterium]
MKEKPVGALGGANARFDWARARHVTRIVAALEAKEAGSVRFVGGCVRDSLLGETPKDIDIATTLTPDDVMEALKAARLGAAPTGVAHGTVTAIADHKGVEVTTLRADVSTDGRRASVAFTRDWEVDARRRDFTINAIYMTPGFDLFDPVGGMEDLPDRRVRFIGAAEERIREDYLRILRFFRFSARFASTIDAAGLAACAALKDGIRRLSAERIGDEIINLLSLPAPQSAVAAMKASGVMAEVWTAPAHIEALARLKTIAPAAEGAIALAALYGEAGEGIDVRLRLSNADGERRRKAVRNAGLVERTLGERAARAALYRMGADSWRDACLVAQALYLAESEKPDTRDANFERLASLPDRWAPPACPFSGKDALAAGVAKGPSVASVIRAAEARWIAEDFPSAVRAGEIFAEEAARVISKG